MVVQSAFGNINPNGIVYRHRYPMLVVEGYSAALYTFRPHAKTVADLTLKRSFVTKPLTIRPPP